MILHKEDLDAIRDLVKEEVAAALGDKQPAKVKPAKPEKVEEKK